jgi:hypothetical protein
MKRSVETKVAAAVAAGFAALTFGAIAQENSGSQNGYGRANNTELSIHMSQDGYNSSVPGRSKAGENSD